jgi:hypothetical protein
LNADGAGEVLAGLAPLGEVGVERLKAFFEVDKERQLLVTVEDVKTGKRLLEKAAVVKLH